MPVLARAEQDALSQWVEQIAPDAFQIASPIARIEWRTSTYSSSYASYIGTLRLVSGDEHSFFLKDFGFSQLSKDGRVERRDREIRVYRDLLARANLDTPKYYASMWDEDAGRFWLLLEFVRGAEVRHSGLEYWIAAAGWLGRMQGHFLRSSVDLNGAEFLLRHDADRFRTKGFDALRNVFQIATPLGKRFETILRDYDRLVDLMAAQPRTLVHGAYRPSNILISLANSRVCVVDWEVASYGATLYDLAFFADGFKPPTLDRIFDTYEQEAATHGVAVPERHEMKYVFDVFRFYRIVNWLSRAVEKGFSEKETAKLVALGDEISRLVY